MFAHKINQMISAKSSDGKNFTLEPGTRLEGGMPALVALEDGKFRMYFNSFPDNSIKSAISADGFNFEIESGTRLSGNVVHPSVLQLANGTYKMYYDQVTGDGNGPDSWTVMSASSVDGLTWTKDQGVRIPKGCGDDEEDLEEDDEESDVDSPIEKDDCLNGAWNVNARLEDDNIVLYFSLVFLLYILQ